MHYLIPVFAASYSPGIERRRAMLAPKAFAVERPGSICLLDTVRFVLVLKRNSFDRLRDERVQSLFDHPPTRPPSSRCSAS